MEVSSSGDSHHHHVSHGRDVNGEVECFGNRFAVEQQFCAVGRRRSLRVEMFAVVGPLRRTTLIQRGLAVHNKHPRLLSVYVVPDICVVVAVWTEGDTLYRTVGNLRLAVNNKTGVIPIGWSFHVQVRGEEAVLAVGSEI